MRAVDTNVLVRLVTRDDAQQVQAAEAFIEKGAWVSHLVLVETTWVLSVAYSRSATEIGVAIEMLLSHQHLAIEAPDAVAAALSTFRERPSLGFSDCLVVEVARKAGHLPLGTFDRTLGRVPGAQRL